MIELSDNEEAVLELLAAKPRTLLPPRISEFAERLSQLGFAIFDQGAWYVTAAGLQVSHHRIH